MAIIGEWIRRLRFLLQRSAMEDELRREMEAHRAEMGEPPAFGNTLRLREEARDAWGWRWLDDLVAGHALRVANAAPQPRVCADGDRHLALGIGVNIGMFSLVNGLLFGPYTPVPTKWWRWTPTVQRRLEKRETSPTRTIATSRQARPASLRTWRLTQWRSPVWMPARGAAGVCRRGDRRLLPRLWHACGARTVSRWKRNARRRDRCGRHQPFPLGATRRHAGNPRPRRAHQRRTIHSRRSSAGGIHRASIPGPEVFLPLGAYKTFKGGTTPSLDSREAHEPIDRPAEPGMPDETAEAALATVGSSSRRLSVNAGYSLDMSRPSSRLMFMPGSGTAELRAWRCC